ncbi:hypothetical protein L4174_023610 (plasmid) [Photobacterium sp. CCB-ST2H9]|uniref:hypothetical protein n=1 Tax=Photobacterium sp. CCB-ST2H9 TaxID=2912855 RepID=UPI0020051A28|nr:hypothetical protein [Photobacterium sp. CCB-ST2H9]UTM60456.1 hypothetical protein L4174_023610 [Photobacterium sp. CCB-ST2H9]
MGGKVDYAHHQLELNRLVEKDQSLTLQQYCEMAGLKYNTARRHLRKGDVKPTEETGPKVPPAEKKRSTKRDWPGIYKQYLQLAIQNPLLNMVEFSERENLPGAQVRRSFSKLRKSGAFSDLEDQLEEIIAQQNVTSRQAARNDNHQKNKVKNISGSQGRRAVVPGACAHISDDHEMGSNDHLAVGDATARGGDGRDHLGRFVTGHKYSTIHGGYVQRSGLDPELLKLATDIEPGNLANEIVTARSQYISMLQYIAEEKNGIRLLYASGESLKDFNNNPIPISKALAEVEFGLSGRLRALEASIASMAAISSKSTHDAIKLQHASMKLPAVDPWTAVNKTAELLKRASELSWSALDTAKQFEMLGIPVPMSVEEEAKREIATFEPVVEDEGLTDDELEAAARAYQRKKARHDQWLKAKRKVTQEAIARAEEEEMGQGPQFEQQPDDELETATSEELPDEFDDDEFNSADFDDEVEGG